MFIFGAVVFTAASLAGGLATGPAMLLAARVVQGAGAAALAPTSLSLITASHPDEHQRQRALTLWSIMGGTAGLAGFVAVEASSSRPLIPPALFRPRGQQNGGRQAVRYMRVLR